MTVSGQKFRGPGDWLGRESLTNLKPVPDEVAKMYGI